MNLTGYNTTPANFKSLKSDYKTLFLIEMSILLNLFAFKFTFFYSDWFQILDCLVFLICSYRVLTAIINSLNK